MRGEAPHAAPLRRDSRRFILTDAICETKAYSEFLTHIKRKIDDPSTFSAPQGELSAQLTEGATPSDAALCERVTPLSLRLTAQPAPL